MGQIGGDRRLTWSERTALTLRVMGLLGLAWGVNGAFRLRHPLATFVRQALAGDRTTDFGVFVGLSYCATAAAGLATFLAAGGLGRLLPPAKDADPLSGYLQLGVVAIGLAGVVSVSASLAVTALAATGLKLGRTCVRAAPLPVAAAMLVWRRQVADRLARFGRRAAATAEGRLIAVGFLLLGVYFCLETFTGALEIVGSASVLAGMVPAELTGRTLTLFCLGIAAELALAMALIVWAGRLAAWLSRRHNAAHRPGAAALAVGPADVIAMTAFGLAAWGAVSRAADLAALGPREWQGVGAFGSLLWAVFAPAAVGLGLLWAAARAGRLAGRWLYPPVWPGWDKSDRVLATEVLLGLIGLHLVVRYGFTFSWAAFGKVWQLGPLGAAIALLLLRADLAKLLWGRDGSDPGGDRRAAALRPWLVLLGVSGLLRHLPRLGERIARAAVSRDVYREAGGPYAARVARALGPYALSALVGLLLVLAARPLSRLLSRGPMFGWPRGAVGG